MAYADQEMSGNKITAIIAVALIHILVGYALISGLAYEAVEQVMERVTTVDIEEPPPPEEEPPPPPEEVPETVPPPFVPPPQLNVRQDPPQQRSNDRIIENDQVDRRPQTKLCNGVQIAASAECGPPTTRCPDGTTVRQGTACPEPKPRVQPKAAAPRNSPGGWVTNSDYRSAWIRRELAGTVSFSLSIGADGKVTGCSVTGGNAPQELKDASCSLIQRRARFNAATDGEGRPTTGSYSNTVRWQIPE